MLKACRHFAILLLISSSAWATITSVTISPTFPTVAGTTTNPIVYTGMTDAINSISGGCTGICDSCTAQSFVFGGSSTNSGYTSSLGPLCSKYELSPNTTIYITITATPNAAATSPVFQVEAGSTYLTSAEFSTTTTPPTTLTVGQSFSVTFALQWKSVCQYSSIANSDCLGSFSENVTVGWGANSGSFTENGAVTFDYRYVKSQTTVSSTTPPTSPWASWKTGPASSDYEGFYNFYAFPGDQKIYITSPVIYNSSSYVVGDLWTNVTTTSASLPTSPDASGMVYNGVRVYYIQTSSSTPGTFTVAGGGAASTNSYQDLTFTNGYLTPQYISNLVNLENTSNEYQLVLASIDQAGILTFFTNPNTSATTPMSFVVGTGTTQAAQPQKVYGALAGQGCFIASAAYGSPLAPQIRSLREFRGRYLMNFRAGRSFVRWYYNNSPEWAAWLESSDSAKAVVRVLLVPLIIFSDISLSIGLVGTFVLCFGLFLLPALLIRHLRRPRNPNTEARS
jgi:hypothetical protein